MSQLIEISHGSKSFGGARALDDVSLDIRAGEVHALVGENGAGKSTLIKILGGSLRPDGGVVRVDGKPIAPGDIAAAEAAGIAVIHQESTAFLHLNAQDNIFVGREPRRCGGLLLDRARMRRETHDLLDRLGERLDTTRPLDELSVAARQVVGIARALSRRSRVLVLDEPTASLSARETEALFAVVRQLQQEGAGLLYVSHRLDEVFALADRVTVLRDGRRVATHPIADVTQQELIRLMVGRALVEMEPAQTQPLETQPVAAHHAAVQNGHDKIEHGATRQVRDRRTEAENPQAQSRQTEQAEAERAKEHRAGEVVLEVENLNRAGVFHDVSLQVRAGEIVGLAGLVGAGRSEVATTIFGIERASGGEVLIAGKPVPPGSVRAAMACGVALVPEDRQHLGLVLPMTVRDNLTLAVLRELSRRGLRSRQGENELSQRLMRELAVRAASASIAAENLSGGNQQKLVIGKWLATAPRVLILDEPTRGVDVGAKAEVYRLVRGLAQNGMATLLISSDLPEILALSDRVLVMREGAISGELSRDAATQENILALALPDATAAIERPNQRSKRV